jgi:hypothetical protein
MGLKKTSSEIRFASFPNWLCAHLFVRLMLKLCGVGFLKVVDCVFPSWVHMYTLIHFVIFLLTFNVGGNKKVKH